MSRKAVIICLVLAVALLAFVAYSLSSLFVGGDSDDYAVVSNARDSKQDVLCAVPADAILVMESSEKNLHFMDRNSGLYRFVSGLPKAVSKFKNATSVHYTAKNELSTLYVLSVPAGKDVEAVRTEILNSYPSLNRKNKIAVIYSDPETKVLLSFWNNYILMTQKETLMESSLRHLSQNTSILDLSGFPELTKLVSGQVSVYVNNSSLGKIFSGMVNRDYLKYADFARSFSDWIISGVKIDDSVFSFDGIFVNNSGSDNFMSVLSAVKEERPEIYDIIPSTSTFVFNMSFDDVSDYLQRYKSYLESLKSYRDNPMSMKWLQTLDLKAIALADVPMKDRTERLMFLKLGRHSTLKDKKSEAVACTDFENKDMVSALFGGFFAPTSEDCYMLIGDWMVVGSRDAVSFMENFSGSAVYRTLGDYIGDLSVSEYMPKKSRVSLLLAPLAYDGQLEEALKPQYVNSFRSGRKDINTEYVYMDIDGTTGRFKCYDIRENLASLPSHIKVKGFYEEGSGNQDFKLDVFRGPFKVYNFHTKKDNEIRTNSAGEVLLVDHKDRLVRKHRIDGEICGYVELIDYLKNNKYQAMFAAGNSLYLMDRLGRWVSGFPKKLDKEVLLGPAVFDFNDNKDYKLVVLHSDNSVMMYDKDGNKDALWKEIRLKEKIKSIPEPLKMNGSIYWAVRTTGQTLIYDESGTIVADFSKKKKLSPSTELVRKSDYELQLKAANGDNLLLNLKKGTLKKI